MPNQYDNSYIFTRIFSHGKKNMSISTTEYLVQDYVDVYDLDDKMLRVGEDYAIYETVDKNHHYEDVYNYVVDR